MGTAATLDEEADGSARTRGRPALIARLPSWLPVAVAVVIAALLSLPRLGVRTLWLDEAYTVGATTELLDTWRATGVTQALYYALVWPVTHVSTDPAWIRLPSALLGLAAVVVVHRAGRRLGGERVGLLAAGSLALSWGLAHYSVEARSYTLALLLVAISWLALLTILRPDDGDTATGGDRVRRRWWRAFFVATALTPLAHGLATLNYVVQVGALLTVPGASDDRRALVRRALLVVPVLAAELAAMFLLGAAEVGDWVPPLSMWQMRGFKQLLLGYGATGVVLGALTAAAIVDVVRRYLRERTREAWLQLLPVFWAVGPTVLIVAISLVRPYAAARYAFPSLPAFFLLIAALLVRHLATTWRLALVAVVLAPLLLVDQRYVTTEGIEDWSELTACIAANVQPGDRLVTAGAHRSALDYYWPDHPELATVEPLSPREPLGEIRRLYTSRARTYEQMLDVFFDDTSRSIWFVDRLPEGRLGVVGMAFDSDIAARYDLVTPWYFEGDLTLTRLDPIGADRPRGDGPCETVPTPDDMRPPS